MLTFGNSLPEEDSNLPKLYWIPKLHKNLYKQRYTCIAGSGNCSTKPLSQILTRILTAVKEGLQKYCDTTYARSGVNQMWILKNSKELLEKKIKRKVQGVPQSQTAALPRPQEEEETDKSKQAQIEQTYEKH